MPHIHKQSGEIVVRVVYDGAPEAGKTTNLLYLTEKLGLQQRPRPASPGSTGRRTEFFDYVHFDGGYVDGRKLACQVVSVPGQAALLRRRAYLLDTADVIIFVVDSRAGELAEASRQFEATRAVIQRRLGTPLPTVVQANKQDAPNTLSPASVRQALDLSSEVQVIGASAGEGTGVLETFLAGVRAGSRRVRELLSHEGEAFFEREGADTMEELLSAIVDADSD